MNTPPTLRENSTLAEPGWLPFSLRHDGARLVVDWCKLADAGLAEPFFDQSIQQRLRDNPQALLTTTVETLTDLNAQRAVRKPAGFIFHVSRCGSTLIAQMLSAIRQCAVFSEPAILETLLRGTYQPAKVTREPQQWLLQAIMQALVSHRTDCHGAFIKFTARATLDYPRITQAYPSVPYIFVYREPVEVLVSLVGSQAEHLPPGLETAGLLDDEPQAIKRMRPADFWARVLARQYATALEMCRNTQPLLVNYHQLPAAVWTDIVRHFGIALSADEATRLHAVSARSAKAPGQRFSDDRAAKRAAATTEIRELAKRFVQPYYDRLESLRMG